MDGFVGSQAQTVLQSPEYQRKLEPLLKDMLRAEICMAAMADHENVPFGIFVTTDDIATPRSYSKQIQYGRPNGSGGEKTLCGSVSSLQAKGQAGSGGQLGLYNRNGAVGDSVAGTPVVGAGESFTAARQLVNVQTDALIEVSQGPLRAAAAQIAAKGSGDQPAISDAQYEEIVRTAIRASVSTIVARSGGAMSAASQSFQQGMTQFIADSRTAGWMMAGPSFFQMATIRSQAKDVLNAVPEFSPGSLFSEENISDLMRKEMITDLDALYTRVDKGFQGDTNNFWNPGDELVKSIGTIIAFNPENNDHALVQMKEKGD
jgi:conjugal transfer/type IV secretion protein DotA/TraY